MLRGPLPVTITVFNALAISGTPSDVGTVGVAYTASFTASGGNGSYNWTIASGTLPSGLTFSNGNISGIPTTAETKSNIVVRVTDTQGRIVDSAPFVISTYNSVSISGSLAESAKLNTYYSSTVSALGGTGSYSWLIFEGSLPDGLNLSGGTVSGTPTKTGNWSVILQATDGHGRTGKTGSMSINVAPSIVREPASGEYYSDTYRWIGANITFCWGSTTCTRIPVTYPESQFSYGGATYYRGSQKGYIQLTPVFAIYRTIP